MSSFSQFPDAPAPDLLSVLLIGPDERRRRVVAEALSGCPIGPIREHFCYPADLDSLPQLIHQCDVVIVDLDSDPEYALDVV